MKTNLLILFISCNLTCLSQNWTQIDDFPSTARDDGSAFVIGDSAYCGSGLNSWWSTEGDFYGIDLTNDQWFTISSLPVEKARQYAAGFSDDSKGFIFGGHDGTNFLNDLWEYNPQTNTWSEKTPLPSFGRNGSSCFVVNNTAYIIGGKSQNELAINEVWAYDIINDTWIQKNDFPFGNTWRSSATSIVESGYLIFGQDELNDFQNQLYEYNVNTDSWTNISTFPSNGRSYSFMNTLNDNLYIGFGIDEIGNSHNDLWKFDIITNSWDILSGLPALGRKGGMSFKSDNCIYYTTGINESDSRITETWKYNPTLTLNNDSGINIRLFPNPAENSLEIISDQKIIVNPTILSSHGKLIKIIEDLDYIDISQLNSGVYFINIQTEQTILNLKFIKE